MRVQPPIQIECASPGESLHPFCSLDPGDTVTVALCSASSKGATSLLKTQSESFKASLPPGVRLLKGDTLTLLLTGRRDGRLFFKLLSVNGQSVLPEASHLEQNLLRMGIPPGSRNMRLARFLWQNGYTPGPEMIGAFEKVSAKAPGLPASVAAFMAERGILPDGRESDLFSRPGQLPDRPPGEPATQNFYYQQIPIRFRGRDHKAGLFVFRDKARLKPKKQTVVFLALQTQNMGRVEARLKYDAGGLTADFFLRSGSVQKYLSNHLDALKKTLGANGLRLLVIRASAALSPGSPPASGDPNETPEGGIDIKV